MKLTTHVIALKILKNIPNLDTYTKRQMPQKYIDHLQKKEFIRLSLTIYLTYGPEIELVEQGYIKKKSMLVLFQNDYLGFTQHPQVKNAVISKH